MHLYDHDAFGADAPSPIAGATPAGVAPPTASVQWSLTGPSDPVTGGYSLTATVTDNSIPPMSGSISGSPTNDQVAAAIVSALAEQGISAPLATVLTAVGPTGQLWNTSGSSGQLYGTDFPLPPRTFLGTVMGDYLRHRYLFLGAGAAIVALVVAVLVIHHKNKKKGGR